MSRRGIIVSSLALMLVLASASLPAQGLRRQAGPRGRQGPGIERLQERLNLTPAQVNGIQALQENRRKEMQSLNEEMRQKRQYLRSLMQQTNPNPTDVGNAALAVKETRERARAINERFLSGVKGLLTPEQQQKLPKGFR